MTASFEALFDTPPRFRAQAPGRVNLIGEHTDYNGGFVLPVAIPQHTQVELRPRAGDAVRVASTSVADQVLEYRLGAEASGRLWLDYVQGVTHVLTREGHALGGFDALIRSTVPLGSGLSSSAALVVALLRALREAFSLALDDVQLALVGQRAETDFVGVPVGVMDPLACSLATERAALFLDTRTLAFERVPLPESVELVVVSSGVTHSHAGGDYRRRRRECEDACQALGVRSLRELTLADLDRALRLPDPLGRRVRHVLTENARVLGTVEALRSRQLERAGQLLLESHASMRDDFEVSVPEIDLLVSIASAQPDVLGARLTGGGFGGSIVALTRAGRGGEVARQVAALYAARSGQAPTVLVPAP